MRRLALAWTPWMVGCIARVAVVGGTTMAGETSYESAVARSRAENRILLLAFTRSDCLVCRRMTGRALSDPEVVAALQAFVVYNVDVQSEPLIASKHRVLRVPDVRFVDPDGRPLEGLYSRSPADIATRLKKLAEDHARGHR